MLDDISKINSQKLAFLGDAVYELFIRKRIVSNVDGTIGKLNNIKVSKVSCKAQSEMFEKIESLLNEEELSVYKRGRNIKSGRVPKKSSPIVYRRATGIEALFGYLYLKGDIQRIDEFLKIINI